MGRNVCYRYVEHGATPFFNRHQESELCYININILEHLLEALVSS